MLALAALAYQDAEDHSQADALISRLDQDADAEDGLVAIAKACSMLATGFNEDAFAIASTADTTALTPYQRGRHTRCLGAAALETDRIEAAVSAWTSAYRYPYPMSQTAAIAQSTWRAISQLPERKLAGFDSTDDALTGGWYALGLIAARSMLDTIEFVKSTTTWQQQFPHHPANALIGDLVKRSESMSVRSETLALILPFDDTLGAAAEAIRDGFVTAWYLDPRTQSRPSLKIYSSASGDFAATVSQAIADGADFLVGPLRKSLVAMLLKQGEISVNVLALNVSDQANTMPRLGFYQFGLTPDDEAAQVARRALANGKRALIMAPDTPWGKRLATAYSTTWTKLGGTVVAQVHYEEDPEAYSQAAKRSLNIDLSEARQSELRRTIGLPLHFEPRRRDDIDVILLAAFPDNARQILPQLRYFRAEKIPVFATSHVYSGGTAIAHDSDLDGVTFGDMPWLFGAADTESFNLVRRNWSKHAASFARLYGFGIDAYRVLPYLAKMRFQRNLRVPGVTGDLSMDNQGVVHRNMTWLRFVDGLPTLLDYAGNERTR